MYLSMVCGMFVCVSLSINVCMFTMSNALLISNATAMVRVGGMGCAILLRMGCCRNVSVLRILPTGMCFLPAW